MITIKYKLGMSPETPTKFVELKINPTDAQKTKVYYPDLIVSVDAILDVPNKPQQVFSLKTK